MTTHLDLCSGIGGFALAARWLGMQTIGFCEIDPFCQRVLAKNFPGVPIHDDLTTLRSNDVREWITSAEQGIRHDGGIAPDAATVQRTPFEWSEPDGIADERGTVGLITGGYPCQPFSLAGKRLGAEDDRHLWPYIAALVAELRPRYCLFENVAGHITLGLDRVLADLEAIGYTCRPVVVPACALNAPHRRDRVWLMAHADDQRVNRAGPRSAGRDESADEGFTLAHAAGGRRDGRSHIEGQGSPERGRIGINGQNNDPDTTDGGVRRGSAQGQSGFAALRGEAVLNSNHGDRNPSGSASHQAGTADLSVGGDDPAFGLTSDEVVAGLGQSHDGISRRLDVGLARAWNADWEAGVPRVSDGCTDRVNKLKALGNAIVPQVAYTLMAAMLERKDT